VSEPVKRYRTEGVALLPSEFVDATDYNALQARVRALESLLDDVMLGGERDKNWRKALAEQGEPT
jgi:hypothetical protein